jgi:hypothetical protein
MATMQKARTRTDRAQLAEIVQRVRDERRNGKTIIRIRP